MAGNHDFPLLHSYMLAKRYIQKIPGTTYLQDTGKVIEGISFYGSPWTSIFNNWAFMLFPEELKEKWRLIPKDTNVLITHGPPSGILDLAYGKQKGCQELLRTVKYINPVFHVFGHIHEGFGVSGYLDDQRTTFINCSICDAKYRPDNEPVVFEL